MKMFMCAAAMLLCLASQANSAVRISEWAYQGADGEFIEFTNYGPGSVNFAGWSFDDDSRIAGTVDLSAFGIVAAGESVVLTEIDAALFRDGWNLSPLAKIIGNNSANLGRNDEINLYNGLTLVDRLTFGDQNLPGTIRTQNISGNPGTPAQLGSFSSVGWVFSSTSDSFGSYTSDFGDIGNPGIAPLYIAVPEPSSIVFVGLSALALVAHRR